MDSGKILTAIVSSVLTAMVFYVGGLTFGLFETRGNRVIAVAVAEQIMTDETLSRALLSVMEDSKKFVGPQGDQGPKGSDGPPGNPGPIWLPKGAIFLISKQTDCPPFSEETAGFNIQTAYANTAMFDKTRKLAVGDSTWDVSNSWNGLHFKACHFN